MKLRLITYIYGKEMRLTFDGTITTWPTVSFYLFLITSIRLLLKQCNFEINVL